MGKRPYLYDRASAILDDDFLMLDSPTGGTRSYQVSKLIASMAAAQAAVLDDWSQASALIHAGLGSVYFPIGSLVHTPWRDPRTGTDTEWDYLWRVAHHGTATLKSGEVVPALFLHSAYALPFATQYDADEAFYAAPAGGLPAGTYHIGGGTGYQKMLANTDYQFTLTQDLPAGGQLKFKASTYSTSPEATVVCAYASPAATTATEECQVTVGSGGTSLGALVATRTDTVNHVHRHVLGNNRWAESGIRQFLNSDKAAASWWSAKNAFDRQPSYAQTTAGFLSGFDEGFVAHIGEVLVKTALPTCDGGTSGGTEHDETYDRVFLPSAEQLDWACTWLGVPYGLEGEAWDYWVRVYGTTPATMGATHTEFCMSDLSTKSTLRGVFERSAYRGNGSSVAYCYASGYLHSHYANNGYVCAPACCIV